MSQSHTCNKDNAPQMQPKELTQPCSKCGRIAWERLPREGFFQTKFLPLIGKYPWRCALCNVCRYFSLRIDPAHVHRRSRTPERSAA